MLPGQRRAKARVTSKPLVITRLPLLAGALTFNNVNVDVGEGPRKLLVFAYALIAGTTSAMTLNGASASRIVYTNDSGGKSITNVSWFLADFNAATVNLVFTSTNTSASAIPYVVENFSALYDFDTSPASPPVSAQTDINLDGVPGAIALVNHRFAAGSPVATASMSGATQEATLVDSSSRVATGRHVFTSAEAGRLIRGTLSADRDRRMSGVVIV